MTAEQLTTIITNILTGTGVLTFMYFLVKSLKREISSLNKTIEAQNKTLEVMEKRIAETEKVGDIYKGLITELPEYIEKYKKIISATKDSVIAELERANQIKDEKLKETRELELQRLELQEQMLAELPRLREELIATTEAIQGRVESFDLFQGVVLNAHHIRPYRAVMGGRMKVIESLNYEPIYRKYVGTDDENDDENNESKATEEPPKTDD